MSGDAAVTTRFWWLRHAPLDAPAGLIAGQADIAADLSDTALLADAARRLPADAVWIATPLQRSRETARALGALSPLQLESGLMEQDFGRWQGMTHQQVWEGDQAEAARFWADPVGLAPPGGESFASLCDRVAATVTTLCAAHAGRDIIAIAHAGPIRAAIGQALGVGPRALLGLCCDPLHLTRIDHLAVPGHPPLWRLVGVNIPPR